MIFFQGGKVHYPWNLTTSDARNSNFQVGDDYPKPIVIAPEWSRHFNKKSAPNSGGGGRGNQRGIDFYFKKDGKKKWLNIF